tara:strand:- start:493 stop:642 length:150 start_codon:yes stop_codon:yes gene_type:complete
LAPPLPSRKRRESIDAGQLKRLLFLDGRGRREAVGAGEDDARNAKRGQV